MIEEVIEGSIRNVIETNDDLYEVIKYLIDKLNDGYKNFKVRKVKNSEVNRIVETVLIDFRSDDEKTWKYLWLKMKKKGWA